MMMRALIVAAAMALASPAAATGNADCEIDDENLRFLFEALYSYGTDGPLFQARAEIEPKTGRIPGLSKIELGSAALQEQRFRGNDFRIVLHTTVPAEFTLEIETVRTGPEEMEFEGRYVLRLAGAEPRIFRGRAECSAG